jgi:RNA polymerase sigma-70 factor (ECF subfamily)
VRGAAILWLEAGPIRANPPAGEHWRAIEGDSPPAAGLAPRLLSMSFMNAIANASDDRQSPDTDHLYRNYGAAVRRWATQLAGSRSDAEDIVQEVFLVVHQRRAELPALRHPGSWLFRIVENVARHLWRRRRRAPALATERLTELPDHSPTPLDLLVERRLRDNLSQALAALSERDRRLLVLGDLRRATLAAPPDLNPDTVRVWRHRARLRLARSLRQLEGPDLGSA